MARFDTCWIYCILAVTLMLLLSANAAGPTLTLVAEQQLDSTLSFSSLSTKMIQLSNGNYRLCVGGITTTGSVPKFSARDISTNGSISVNATENTPTLPSSYTSVSDISVMDSSLNKCLYSVLHSEVTASSYAIVQADSGTPSTNSISLNSNILTVNASSTTQTYLLASTTQTLTTTFNSLSISTVTSMCGTVVSGSSVMYAVGRKSSSVLVGFDGAAASVDLSFTGYQVACDALSASQWIVCYDTETTSSTVTCINNQRVAQQVLQSASGVSASRPHVSYLNSNSIAAVVLQTNLSAIGVVVLDSSLQELITLQIESTNYAQLTADAIGNVLSIVFSNATGAYVRTYLFDQGLSTTPSSAPVDAVNATLTSAPVSTPVSGPVPAISPVSPPVPETIPPVARVSDTPISSPTANISTPSAAVITTPTPGDSSASGADAKVLGPAISIPVAAVAVGVFLLVFFLKKRKKAKAEKKKDEEALDGDANLSVLNPTADPGRYSAIVSENKQGHYANISSAAKEDGINPTSIQPGEIDKRMQIPYRSLRFTKEIGAGSYGKVFLGEWRGAQVAIKVSNSITDIDGFLSEAKLTLGITPHPNLVQTFGVSLDGPNPCIVLEFCGGGSLDNVVFDREKHVTDEQRRDYALKIAYGLLHLHNNNIVHRDLAARNILLTNDGQPKISDFGMSRIIQEESSQGKTKTSFGPIRWMAPESLKDKSYSTKSDVWSYGILLYEIASGKEPHTEEDQLSIAVRIRDSAVTPVIPSDCDPVLKQVMEMCWKPDPNDRPSMETIAEFLRRH